VLNDAVKVMKEYPDLRIEIAGHTSSEGVAAKNLKLSQDRAASVKTYFVAQGIPESRITTIGYGSDKPIALNSTPRGREKNRRIEFRLLTDTGAAPTGAPGGAAPAAKSGPVTKAPAEPPIKLPPAGEPMPAMPGK